MYSIYNLVHAISDNIFQLDSLDIIAAWMSAKFLRGTDGKAFSIAANVKVIK